MPFFQIFFLIMKETYFPPVFILFEFWNFQMIPHYFPPYFINIEEVVLSSLIKILEWLEVPGLKLFKWNSNHFQIPFHFFDGRSHIIFTVGFVLNLNFKFHGTKIKKWKFGKVHLFPLIQLSKSFKFHSISHKKITQAIIPQSDKQSKLFI